MSILERLAAIATAKKSPAKTRPCAPEKTWDNEALVWSKAPLSNLQKSRLAQLAAQAYKAQKYLDVPLDEWRRAEQEIACGKSSLRDCTQTHFLSLVAHFQALAGDTTSAKNTWKSTGRVKGSTILHDTHENRHAAMANILQELKDHKERLAQWKSDPPAPITYPYVLAIVKNQHKKPIDELTAAQLQRLLFTVVNRITAREGRGKTKDRNKSQRRRRI
jgi:hypothetical protein